ncbi:MAG: type II CRISPR-associated endonuclease Cas1 [Arcobacter sp.]|jgi:CRISPR-associated protein Cas1|uniref:type II CRISPR-associated endonuclease Cas1 n=1 Tax=Arcobacter sp. TaxID=1872629 RepID=UPI002A763788|nr:type II CRISPR-associated endonuclease Cas1 [Arcobacter sp.]MDY3204181.1 type II CRISPR-associated endonuclease Cas1 [Arcobacter sp.]
MSFKQIFIKNKSYLSYQNNSMNVKNEFTNTLVCLDDIDIIIIENQQTTITSALLSNLAQSNISVVFVDDKYNPSAISMGLYKNSRTSKIQKSQININKPRLNRLWQTVIYSKVSNQANVLNTIKDDEYLYSLLKRINSGDKNNIEAISAFYYFKELFGKDFSRNNSDDNRNIALNYGYSILRSSIVRYIIAYGLNPSFGMWHSSELNAFNLADDLIEPFRPIVDRYVLNNVSKNNPISSTNKQELVALLYSKVRNNQEQNISVNEAIKNIVASYQSFCLNKRDDIELFSL